MHGLSSLGIFTLLNGINGETFHIFKLKRFYAVQNQIQIQHKSSLKLYKICAQHEM